MKALKKRPINQNLLLVVAVIAAVLIGFGATYFFAKANKDTGVRQVSCTDTCVNLLGDKASPNTLAVTVGSYVSFNSADGKSHDLTLGDPSTHGHSNPGSFESGEFKSDESFRVQFKEEGTYTFTDKLNPKTTIVVVVYTEGKEYKVQ